MITLTNLDGVEMFVWDCSHPNDSNCRICFRITGGKRHFDYRDGGSSVQFSTGDGVTLDIACRINRCSNWPRPCVGCRPNT